MTFLELITEVQTAVQDASSDILGTVEVGERINEAYDSILRELLPQDLEKIGSVTTSTTASKVDLPSDFEGKLLRAYYYRQPIEIAGFIDELLMRDSRLQETDAYVGNVNLIALSEGQLWYYPRPSIAQTITLLYVKKPTLMVSDTDTPALIPTGRMQRGLLVNKVASDLFQIIEQGVDGDKVNHRFHERRYKQAWTEYDAWLKNRKPQQTHTGNIWNY